MLQRVWRTPSLGIGGGRTPRSMGSDPLADAVLPFLHRSVQSCLTSSFGLNVLNWMAHPRGLGGVFAQRGHSARTAPIITLFIPGTTPCKPPPLQKDA